MGGVAGHAGLFLTTADLARFCRMLVGQGELDGVRILMLECDAEGFAELFLAHSKHIAPQTNAASDMNIYRVGLFLVFYHFFETVITADFLFGTLRPPVCCCC